MYTGSDNGLTETYMMPGTHPNPQITLLQAPEGVDYMANELVPEVIYDQGLYYPAADYYGYFCTGLEPQSEWNDQQRFFGVDGQELHYPQALQTESSPYVYYSPSYGYAQSSYNPYNPYIPGAVMGLDGPIIGTQQYFSDPSYQLPVSSPTAYMPVIVQPNLDVSSSVFGTVSPIPSRQTSVGSKYPQSRVSSSRGAASQGTASNIPKSEPLHNASSNVSINVPSGSVTQMTQGRTSGLRQATDRFPNGSGSSFQNPSNGLSSNLLPNFGTSTRGWAAADRFRPRFQFNGITKNGNGGQDILGEQNRGPRTNKSKGQWEPTTSSDASVTNAQAIVICADQYNRGDFPVDYPDAKFFIIKSYSEDDVHKSIKYNVWSSTLNGNKRLNSAYEDAHKLSAGKPNNCPIFLFFSVNASGQFCGAAEMIGPVDFDKDMDFWQQDKWTGSFPVKWHMIKDVPNTSFRHIVLENNENKPVTNSRDTQEIMYEPGMNMLNIFKSNPLKTSILDDFMFYEERQKIMQEEKFRYTGRSYNTYVPAIVSANKSDSSAEQNDSINEIAKKDEGQSSVASDKSSKSEKQNFDVLNSSDNENPIDQQVAKNPDVIEPSSDKKDVINAESSVMKMKSLSLDSKEDNMKAVEVEKSPRTDFVTVGSMLIEVNGSFPIEPKVAKLDEKGVISDENSSHQ